MIYDEQKTAGMQLQQIELRVSKIRDDFTKAIINNQGSYLKGQQEVDNLFEYGQQRDSQIHWEVDKRIKDLKNRNLASQLQAQLGGMTITKPKDDSKNKTIKDKLEKGLYNT